MIVSVDTVLFTMEQGALRVLLHRRPRAPYPGWWAIPGGFVERTESLEGAAARVLASKTGLRDVYLEQLYTFGDAKRDPRGRVITVAYVALVAPGAAAPSLEAAWTPMEALPRLAFDHARILEYALQRLRNKLEYTPIGFRLLPEEFTLTDVQGVYEAILGRRLDKRNFRKKLLSLKVLRPVAKLRREGPHRPARLYRFEEAKWSELKEKGNVFVF